MGNVSPVPLGAVVAAPSAPAAAPATGDSSHTTSTQAERGKTADIEMETGDLPVCGLTESHSQSSPAHNVQGEQGRAEPTDLTTSTHFPLPSEQVQRRSTHMPDVSPSSSAVEEAQPRAVASTVASLAEEAKADEPADAHMAVQEGEASNLLPSAHPWQVRRLHQSLQRKPQITWRNPFQMEAMKWRWRTEETRSTLMEESCRMIKEQRQRGL